MFRAFIFACCVSVGVCITCYTKVYTAPYANNTAWVSESHPTWLSRHGFPNLTLWIRSYHGDRGWFRTLFTSMGYFARFFPLVVVLDDTVHDQRFAVELGNTWPFPAILFETLPNSVDISRTFFTGRHRMTSIGYNRQQYSTFFADLYTDLPVIGVLDADVMFTTQVTPANFFMPDGRPILWSRSGDRFCKATEMAIGRSCPADFMADFFPIFLHRDTFAAMRKHVVQHMKVNSFLDAFLTFSRAEGGYSQFSLLCTYAWHFQRERYHFRFRYVARYGQTVPAGMEDSSDVRVNVHYKHESHGEAAKILLQGYCFSCGLNEGACAPCAGKRHDYPRTQNSQKGQNAVAMHYQNVAALGVTDGSCLPSIVVPLPLGPR